MAEVGNTVEGNLSGNPTVKTTGLSSESLKMIQYPETASSQPYIVSRINTRVPSNNQKNYYFGKGDIIQFNFAGNTTRNCSNSYLIFKGRTVNTSLGTIASYTSGTTGNGTYANPYWVTQCSTSNGALAYMNLMGNCVRMFGNIVLKNDAGTILDVDLDPPTTVAMMTKSTMSDETRNLAHKFVGFFPSYENEYVNYACTATATNIGVTTGGDYFVTQGAVASPIVRVATDTGNTSAGYLVSYGDSKCTGATTASTMWCPPIVKYWADEAKQIVGGVYKTFIVPLSFLLGIFRIPQLLPLCVMGSMKLELTINDFNKAFLVNAGAVDAYNYEICQPELRCDDIEFAPSIMNSIVQSARTGQLWLQYYSWGRQTGQAITASPCTVNLQAEHYNITSIFATVKKVDNKGTGHDAYNFDMDEFWDDTQTVKSSYVYQISNKYYPQVEVSTAEEVYVQNLNAWHSAFEANITGNIGFDKFKKELFVLGIDCDVDPSSSISGVNNRRGVNPISFLLNFSTTKSGANGVNVNLYYLYSKKINIKAEDGTMDVFS